MSWSKMAMFNAFLPFTAVVMNAAPLAKDLGTMAHESAPLDLIPPPLTSLATPIAVFRVKTTKPAYTLAGDVRWLQITICWKLSMLFGTRLLIEWTF
jgi:hypothetical protein